MAGGTAVIFPQNDIAPGIAQTCNVSINIFTESNTKVSYTFRAEYNTTIKIEEFFGELAPQYMRHYINEEDKTNPYIEFLPNTLNGFMLINPVLSYNSGNEEDLPLNINAGLSFGELLPGSLWEEDFALILNGLIAEVSGCLTFIPLYENFIPFIIEIKLPFNMLPSMPQSHLFNSTNTHSGILPEKAGLSLKFEHAVSYNATDPIDCPTSMKGFIQLSFKFASLETDIIFSTTIFNTQDFWTLFCIFPEGLGIIDIINFFAGLFGVSGKSGLLLPPDLNVNTLKLYRLVLGMERAENEKLKLEEASAILAASQPWQIFPGFTLSSFRINWDMRWSSTDSLNLFSGRIAAKLEVLIGSKVLILDGLADIPELNIKANLTLSESQRSEYIPADIITGPAFDALPDSGGKSSLILARVDIEASYYSRELYIYAEINNALKIRLGNLEIQLTKIFASADFRQSGNTYALGGEIDFLKNDSEIMFALSLGGSYSGGNWYFYGRLSRGRVKIVDLVNALLKTSVSGFTIDLTEIDLEYSYNKAKDESTYAVIAAFSASFGTILGVPAGAGGRIQIKSDKSGLNYASVMLKLIFGRFDISVQADNFHDQEKAIYHLFLTFRESQLRGTYLRQPSKSRPGEYDGIINISFQNLTFGDIVSWFMELINPNSRYDLPSPWDILNRIDLSKMNLSINLTTKDISFIYNINLNILGLATVEYIGIEYIQDKNKVNITGKISTQEEPFSFDPITENPPDIVNNPKAFKLYFLGLGQHMSNDGINNAVSVEEAVSEMIKGFGEDSITYSEKANWLFGAKFTVKDSLRVSVVLNDPSLYGLLVEFIGSNIFPALKGLTFEILYRKISKNIGMFKGTLTLPEKVRHFELGVMSITVGTFSAEIYTNGDFLIDLGFPYNTNFSRSFAFAFGYFSGRGGIYFGILSGDTSSQLPPVKRGVFNTVLMIGIGLEVGIGRTFNFGIVSGGLTLSVFGIFEGLFAAWEDKARNENALYVKASATIGIVGRVFIRVNLVIIVLDASAELKAYAALKLESYRQTEISLAVSLRLKASVKILFFRINVSFDFSQQFSFTVGDNKIAPWESNARLLERIDHYAIDVFSAEKVYKETNDIEINFTFSPVFSLKQNTNIAAFLPVLSCPDFENLVRFINDSILNKLPELISSETAYSSLSEEKLSKITYEKLTEHFTHNNLKFVISAAPSPAVTDSLPEGVVMAIPPSVKVNLSGYDSSGKIVFSENIDYDDFDSPDAVDYGYAEKIAQYFKCFDDFMPEDDPKALRTVIRKTTVARLIFRDYFIMLIRSAANKILKMYSSFEIGSGQYIEHFSSFGLNEATILSDNLELKLGAIKGFIIPERTLIITKARTISDIALKEGLDALRLADLNKDNRAILRNRARIELSESFEFDNSIAKLPIITLAAAFYVRHGHYMKDEYFRNHYDYIIDEAALSDTGPNPVDWHCDGEHEYRFTKGSLAGYFLLPGDTVEIIAKVCALLTNYSYDENSPYYYREWDEYLQWFMAENNTGDPGTVIDLRPVRVPVTRDEGTVAYIDSDFTLFNLSCRIFADNRISRLSFFTDKQILNNLSSLYMADSEIDIAEGDSIKSLMETYSLSVDEFAAAFSHNREILSFADGELIRILNAGCLPSALIESFLNSPDYSELLGGAVSRFMLQGLRLPGPKENSETIGLYELKKLQFDLQAEKCEKWSFEAESTGSLTADSNYSGQYRTEFDKDKIKVNPFDFTEHYSLKAMSSKEEYFGRIPKVYPITGGFVCESRAYHLFSEALINSFPAINDAIVKYKNTEINVTYGVMMKINAEEENGAIIIKGLSPKDRLTLKGILTITQTNLNYSLLYKPSALNGLENTLVSLNIDPNDLIIKANLSKETHMFAKSPSNQELQNAYKNYTAAFGTRDFLRFIWECSVIGGGYCLCLNKTAEDFAISENNYLWLYIEDDINGNLKDYVNCARSNEVALAAAGETMDLYSSAADESDWRPLYAPGNYGIKINNKDKLCFNEAAEDEAELFSIISYRINGNDYENITDKESKPLIPVGDENKREYSAIVPLYKNVKNSNHENPYSAIAKPANFEVYCRDILGNYAPGTLTETLIPAVNDLMIGIHEWAGLNINFDITDHNGLYAVVNLSSADESIHEISNEEQEIINRSLYQLESSNLSLSGEFIETVDINIVEKEKIIAFGREILDSGGQAVKLSILIPIKLNSFLETARLSLNLTAKRDGPADFPLNATEVVSVINPRIEGIDEDDAQTVAVFTSIAEEAINVSSRPAYYKIAASDENQSDLHLVNISSMLPLITVKSGNTDSQNRLYPDFFALRPLSNKPVTKTVTVYPLDRDGLLDLSDEKSLLYEGIDADEWAKRFLSDIESLLAPDFTLELSKFPVNDINTLISAKEELAEAISQYLIPVEEDSTGRGDLSRAAVKDRLLKNLTLGNAISCTAEYLMDTSFRVPENNKIRLVAEIINSSADAGAYTIGECKFDLSKDRACLIITAQSIYQTGFKLNNILVKIRDMEYDIEEAFEGYETSKWLRFIIPLIADNERFKINLNSDIAAPNPLRNVPRAAQIKEQGNDPCESQLYEWKHRVSCEAAAAEQDTHRFIIKYSEERERLRDGDFTGLFDKLAQYDFIRQELLDMIKSENSLKNNYFKTFAALALEIAELWSPYTDGIPMFKAAANNEQILDCELSFDIDKQVINISGGEGFKVSAKALSEFADGVNFPFDLIIDELSVYEKNIAEVSVKTTRNSNILSNKTVNEMFIYQTETIMAPKFPSAINRTDEIFLNKGGYALSEAGLNEILTVITDKLNLKTIPNMLSLVIWYNYSLEGNTGLKVSLPLAYYPNIPANLNNSEIAANIIEWLNKEKPIIRNSSLTFDITVYANTSSSNARSILQIKKLTALLTTPS